jgi:anti-anti-sigma factor
VNELARVRAERHEDLCLVEVTGEIDFSNAQEVLAGIEATVPSDVARVAVDLSGTTYLDSAGVRLLLQLAERLEARRQELSLVVPAGAPVRSVLELADVGAVIDIVEHRPEGSLDLDGPT